MNNDKRKETPGSWPEHGARKSHNYGTTATDTSTKNNTEKYDKKHESHTRRYRPASGKASRLEKGRAREKLNNIGQATKTVGRGDEEEKMK